MATLKPRKLCRLCSLEMHSGDLHAYCLQCLTTTHESRECRSCKAICLPIYSCRLGIVGDALQANNWPSDWRQKLLQVEDSVWQTPHQGTAVHDDSPDSSPDDDQVDTLPKVTDKTYE